MPKSRKQRPRDVTLSLLCMTSTLSELYLSTVTKTETKRFGRELRSTIRTIYQTKSKIQANEQNRDALGLQDQQIP